MSALPDTEFSSLADAVNMTVVADAAPASIEPLKPGEIFDTTDYDAFQLITANREVDKSHVAKLVESIKKENLLHLMPIKVNMQLEIIDGQHRLEAARILQVPIYYQMADELTEEHIRTLNANSKNWAGSDYLNYWTVKGRPAYVELSRFMKHHPRIKLTSARYLVGANNPGPGAEFKDGRFKAGHYATATRAAALLARIEEEFKFTYAYDQRFVQAIGYCFMNVEGFDENIFMRKVGLQPTALVRCVALKQYLELFERLYNWKTANENRLLFRLVTA